MPREHSQPFDRPRVTVAINRDLLQGTRPYGTHIDVLDAALRVFLEHPDPEVPRKPPAPVPLQRVRIDRDLWLRLQRFVVDQEERRQHRVTQRAIIEEVLQRYLASLEQGAAPDR